ncbi:MAG: hypothetical protein PWQ45_103 [Thermosipho sp. (in: thermotogales)]|jgi:hypothetical protein|nr:hypothetical protein [Thermosipho sp. (in: thermotogales)]
MQKININTLSKLPLETVILKSNKNTIYNDLTNENEVYFATIKTLKAFVTSFDTEELQTLSNQIDITSTKLIVIGTENAEEVIINDKRYRVNYTSHKRGYTIFGVDEV